MADDGNVRWYHGNLSREEAENILLNDVSSRNGCFLVRDSSTSAKDFVLTVYSDGEIIHYQIRRHGEDAFFSIDEQSIVHGLDTLIDYYQQSAHGMVCLLTDPVSKDPPPHDTRLHGRTNLLHRATKGGNFTVASELLKCGYRSLEAKDEQGQTAVHLASIQGHDSILESLIDSGANVNCRDRMGNTPLHYACQKNLSVIVEILLKHGGAIVQIRNTNTGWVPLHEAASRGHKDIIKLLLTYGAPSRPRTVQNETPQKLAEESGHFQCAEILKTYVSPMPRTSKDHWYHGTLERHEAIDLLTSSKQNTDGRFLMRYSDRKRCYVLDMMYYNKPYHFPITKLESYYVIDDGPYLDSLEHIVEHYSSMPDGLPTTLQTPVKPKPKPALPEYHPKSMSTLTLPRNRKGYHWSENNNNICTLPMPPRAPRRSVDSGLSSASSMSFSNSINLSTVSLPFLPVEPQSQDVIGGGEFGAVHKALYQTQDGNEVEVAVKTLHREHLTSYEKAFVKEAEVMMQLNHHCIVKLIGLSRGETLLMVQELVPLGSILSFLIKFPNQVSPDYEMLVWANQIACGMEYLETNRVVHRDLAARNVLLATRHQAKISDFGLSRPLNDEKDYYRATSGGRWPIRWYAPESYNYGTFSSASDVWSFGVTLWEMFSYGEQPFGNLKGSDVIKVIEGGDRLEKPESCSNEIYQTMEKCWHYSSKDRPTFSELSEFFASLNAYENVRELITKTDIS